MNDTVSNNTLLRSQRFRQEREADWLYLDALLERATSKSPNRLSSEELLALPRVYRATLSALSVARATSLDQATVDYLESLCTRAYFVVYGPRSTLFDQALNFFRYGWPSSVRGLWRETLAAVVVTSLAALVAYGLTMSDPDWFYSFVAEGYAQGRSPAASDETLREAIYHDGDTSGLSFFASYLFTHNARIALFAFALGFAFGIPTLMLLAYNGFTIGTFIALYADRGMMFEFTGWLLIHGVTELLAIMIAGAAGLKIGWAIANPGELSRTRSVARASQQAAPALAGAVIMLLLASLIEGFGRQLITNDLIRYAIAGGSALFWGAYFYSGVLRDPSNSVRQVNPGPKGAG